MKVDLDIYAKAWAQLLVSQATNSKKLEVGKTKKDGKKKRKHKN